ncbi:MAG: phosphoglycerate dehydrogenase [Sulfobacillus acidophilus]|uniref:D-3-phosphoglycerate dehydrogenase n=1 Tax=Sulfobacillus acidophilus TaxID=53633 RepID=A0A2T2WFP6_9FIRM|nr:MAG: phosphoglycerate dehydrogenase [Sulfobacillus acidophilus]
MSRPHILVTEKLGPKGLEYLRQYADVDAHDLLPPDELPALMDQYDAVIIRSAHRLTRELLQGHNRLKVVARAGAGVDNVDLEAATEFGIAVINAPGANAIAAAEHTFGLLLAVIRNIVAGDAHVRSGGWDRAAFLGQELYEKRLGIIGLGRVGRQVSRIAHGFRMPVSAYDPFLSADIFEAHDVRQFTRLEDLVAESDILTIHTPKSGPHLDEALLRRLPKGAIVMNVARGGLIDEEALARLLDEGHLAGAGIDVFSHEPPDLNWPLMKRAHVVTTPHLGGSTHEAMVGVGIMTARGVLDALNNQTPPNLVNVPIPDVPEQNLKRLDRAVRILGTIFSRLNPQVASPVVLSLSRAMASSVRPWLRQAALAAFLQDRVDERVNTVNALLVAQRQGITLLVEADHQSDDDPRISLRVEGRNETEVEVSVTEADVVVKKIAGIPVNIPWPERALVTRHHDAPGVVGRVGTLVGQYGINIGQLHLGRRGPQGEALMILTLDTDPPQQLLDDVVQLPDIQEVHVFTQLF